MRIQSAKSRIGNYRRKSEQANLWINRQIQCMVFGSLFEQTTLKHTHIFMRQENSNTGLLCNIKKLFYIFLSMTMVLQLLFLKAHCLKYLWLKLHDVWNLLKNNPGPGRER